ncbi:MAG: nucleotidyltransferase domain-containing protein [Bacteroidetes bacterium]|nr:nucleotidyltransferase domain-containing protein [Bacteroidota bacterium]
MRTRQKNIYDNEKIRFFTEEIKERLGTNLKQLILFGSHARGDYSDDSDYDFAVILNKKNAKSINDIREAEVDFLNRFDELTASLIYDENEWMQRLRLPIGINIEREGVRL